MMTDAQPHEEYQKGYCDGQRAECLEMARKLVAHLPLPVIASVTGLTTQELVYALDGDENVAIESRRPKAEFNPGPMQKRRVRASRIVTPDVIPVSPYRLKLQREVRGLIERLKQDKRHRG